MDNKCLQSNSNFQWAPFKNPPQSDQERPFYFFTHFICLARCHALSAAESEGLNLHRSQQLRFERFFLHWKQVTAFWIWDRLELVTLDCPGFCLSLYRLPKVCLCPYVCLVCKPQDIYRRRMLIINWHVRMIFSRSTADLSAEGRFSAPICTSWGVPDKTLWHFVTAHMCPSWLHGLAAGIGPCPRIIICFELCAIIKRGTILCSISAAACHFYGQPGSRFSRVFSISVGNHLPWINFNLLTPLMLRLKWETIWNNVFETGAVLYSLIQVVLVKFIWNP